MVNQFYEAEIMTEYVIKGNAAVLKCSIPSFVADFVRVESWIDEEGKILTFSDNYGWLAIQFNFFKLFVVFLKLHTKSNP